MKRGLTLVEILVSITIFLVLSGILMSVFANSKRRALIESSCSRLKQLHLAVMMYHADEGGPGDYGTASDMNLPDLTYVASTRLGFSEEMWHSPCGWNPQALPSPDVRSYQYAPEDSQAYADYARVYKEKSVVFIDESCDDSGVPPSARYVRHFGLGILLDGQLVRKRSRGNMGSLYWWSTPEQ
ncbi:MAG: hypothetical protein QOJ65_1530 [Fimbriimonadaceae bacterium]|jgi:prepilin-type N-terminal cleavage/methylation domain-containing protein|nr:hypothetical protein [Fimbriimonadaceae bacterium]